jgi:hypothetical protein
VLGVEDGILRYTLRTASGWRTNFTPLKIPPGEGALTAISCAGVGGALHLVAVIGGGLWHRRRSASGSWSDYTKIVTPAAAGAFTAVSCAGFAGSLFVVGMADRGASTNLWHTIRKSDGSRQTSVGNIKDPGHDRSFTAASCATVGNDLHLLAVNNGDVWHTIRYASGTWKSSFGTPPGQDTQPAFLAIAGSGVR